MSLTITKTFSWNVLQELQSEKEFSWYVGDGPLYWWRVELKDEAEQCGNTCISTTCIQSEILHIMATSLSHLCERLTETCSRQARKYIKKIQKYDRPALCCDVEKFLDNSIPITDTYTTVDFCTCDCFYFIDYCDCNISCISVTPAPSSFIETINLEMMPNLSFSDDVGMTIYETKAQNITTLCNCSLPVSISLRHNIKQMNFLNEFLTRNKLNIADNIKLHYNKLSNSWIDSIYLQGHNEKWQMNFEWICTNEINDKYNWKFNLSIKREINGSAKNSKIVVYINNSNAFRTEGISFDFNTVKNSINTSYLSSIESKILYDEIGIFSGSWLKNPNLSIKLDKE